MASFTYKNLNQDGTRAIFIEAVGGVFGSVERFLYKFNRGGARDRELNLAEIDSFADIEHSIARDFPASENAKDVPTNLAEFKKGKTALQAGLASKPKVTTVEGLHP